MVGPKRPGTVVKIFIMLNTGFRRLTADLRWFDTCCLQFHSGLFSVNWSQLSGMCRCEERGRVIKLWVRCCLSLGHPKCLCLNCAVEAIESLCSPVREAFSYGIIWDTAYRIVSNKHPGGVAIFQKGDVYKRQVFYAKMQCITITLLRGWWGRCEKTISGRKGGWRKKARAARPPDPGLEPGTCRVLGEGPQLHARGAV